MHFHWHCGIGISQGQAYIFSNFGINYIIGIQFLALWLGCCWLSSRIYSKSSLKSQNKQSQSNSKFAHTRGHALTESEIDSSVSECQSQTQRQSDSVRDRVETDTVTESQTQSQRQSQRQRQSNSPAVFQIGINGGCVASIQLYVILTL